MRITTMKMKTGFAIALLGISTTSFAGSVEIGRELHQENCIS